MANIICSPPCNFKKMPIEQSTVSQSTSFATHPRTVAVHLQAPAEDSAFTAWVNHRPAPLWLNSELGAAYKYPDLTQLNSWCILCFIVVVQQCDSYMYFWYMKTASSVDTVMLFSLGARYSSIWKNEAALCTCQWHWYIPEYIPQLLV